MAVLVDDLLKNVLINANSSDRIVIITGYFSPDIIDKIAALGKPFEYYYGMYGVDKIRPSVLSALRNINAKYSNLKISFVNTQRVHTKCYLFYDSNNMFNAMAGSANCSMQGLCSMANAEMLAELNLSVLQRRAERTETSDPIKSESRFSTQPTNAASDKPPVAANTGSPGSCSAAAANTNAGSSAAIQPDRCSARSAATASEGDLSRCHDRGCMAASCPAEPSAAVDCCGRTAAPSAKASGCIACNAGAGGQGLRRIVAGCGYIGRNPRRAAAGRTPSASKGQKNAGNYHCRVCIDSGCWVCSSFHYQCSAEEQARGCKFVCQQFQSGG